MPPPRPLPPVPCVLPLPPAPPIALLPVMSVPETVIEAPENSQSHLRLPLPPAPPVPPGASPPAPPNARLPAISPPLTVMVVELPQMAPPSASAPATTEQAPAADSLVSEKRRIADDEWGRRVANRAGGSERAWAAAGAGDDLIARKQAIGDRRDHARGRCKVAEKHIDRAADGKLGSERARAAGSQVIDEGIGTRFESL